MKANVLNKTAGAVLVLALVFTLTPLVLETVAYLILRTTLPLTYFGNGIITAGDIFLGRAITLLVIIILIIGIGTCGYCKTNLRLFRLKK